MKIKLHNSLGKSLYNNGQLRFIFDEKSLIYLYENRMNIAYRIDDNYFFLKFSCDTRKFEEGRGFGKEDRTSHPNWWKDSSYQWKEMSK